MGTARPSAELIDGIQANHYPETSMSMVIGFIVLGFLLAAALIFGLGWIWPLIAGIMKRRKGTGGTGLIILGGAWLACVLLSTVALTGGAIWLYRTSQECDTPEFDAAAYSGATAKLIAPPDCTAVLSAESENGSYNFTASNGVFTVPAGKLILESYTLTKKDQSGRVWTADWWFYDKTATELSLEPFSEEPVKNAPPFKMTVTRAEAGNGDHRINVQIVDSSEAAVRLSSSQKPAIEIADAAGNIVWSRSLSYG